MRTCLIIIFCACQFILVAQNINLTFENGNLDGFEQCPESRWQVDSVFAITGKRSLHQCFDNVEAGTDIISFKHETLCLDSAITTWQFTVFYNYNPSSSNMWAVWLTSNSNACAMSPDGASSGYIVGVNYRGSDDLLKIWRQDDDGISEILNTGFNWQEKVTSTYKAGIQITRDRIGNWNVFYDSLCLGTFKSVGTVKDNILPFSDYFGVFYKYTSTQDRKLWIDDLAISGKFYKDLQPARIDSLSILNRKTISVWFNEEIDTSKSPVFLLNNQYSPIEIKWKGRTEAILVFNSVFSDRNTLSIDNLIDRKGNKAEILTMHFLYYLPQKYDVIITEILADPFPVVDLPECEFIEVLNNCPNEINMLNWKLTIGDNSIIFPSVSLLPGNYYVVTDAACASNFKNSEKVIGVNSMPSLLNSGDILQLRDDFGKLIHVVDYTSNWYETDYKLEGGWSLELVDSTNPCIGSTNWKESIDKSGGTPGSINSTRDITTDYYRPEISRINLIDSNKLEINFSETMDSLRASDPLNYTVKDENLTFKAEVLSPLYNQVILTSTINFQRGKIYVLNLNDNLMDCSGNQIYISEYQFGVPEEPDSGDLIINEILFESTDQKPEFVELFNNSDKVLEIKGLSIALTDAFKGEIQKEVLLSSEYMQVLPYSYIVFTENKNVLKVTYPINENVILLQPSAWLILSNEGGVLQIRNQKSKILDLAIFNPNMHFGLLNETAGISLERLSPFVPGNAAKSWHSASSLVNYATPGNINSQTMDSILTNKKVSLSPKEFSPDNDGYLDYVNIQYNLDKAGYSVSIMIYNLSGTLVRQIANNEISGVSGNYIWEGLDDEGNMLSMGYYIVYFQTVNQQGQVYNEKETVLLLPQKK